MTTIQIDLPIEQIRDFCRRWKIVELAVFGSVLRDDFCADSDIDVLVTFEDDAPWSLWQFLDARQELEDLLGRNVDMVEKKCVTNPFRRHSILTSRQVIYAAN